MDPACLLHTACGHSFAFDKLPKVAPVHVCFQVGLGMHGASQIVGGVAVSCFCVIPAKGPCALWLNASHLSMGSRATVTGGTPCMTTHVCSLALLGE
jgi:hypothetical protein